ncbi:MAG: retron system putative HNH endonuclease [Acidobacteriaceae bacterium]
MRNIAKEAEPESLTQYRAANATDYDGYPDKDGLRISLVTEQRGICCYCMGRVRAMIGSTKIEHWQAYSKYPEQRLVYSNLLGACMGKEGRRRSDQHCDTYKGDKDLSRNPADLTHNVEAIIRFLADGRITSSNLAFNEDLEHVLNLNMPALTNSRKETLRAFQRTLEKRGTLSREAWEKLLGQLDGASQTGDLMPYCQVIVYWIRKKLARVAN